MSEEEEAFVNGGIKQAKTNTIQLQGFWTCHSKRRHSGMHSIFSRINNVSALLSSCTMALLAAIALSTLAFNADPKGDLAIASIKVSGSFFRGSWIYSLKDGF